MHIEDHRIFTRASLANNIRATGSPPLDARCSMSAHPTHTALYLDDMEGLQEKIDQLCEPRQAALTNLVSNPPDDISGGSIDIDASSIEIAAQVVDTEATEEVEAAAQLKVAAAARAQRIEDLIIFNEKELKEVKDKQSGSGRRP